MMVARILSAVFLSALLTQHAHAEVVDIPSAIASMYESNDELLRKKSQFYADEEQIAQAWARLKPELSVSAAKGVADYDTTILEDQDADYTRVRWSLVQPIYSQERFKGVSRSEKFVASSQVSLELDYQVKMLETLTAYFELLRFKEMAGLIRQEFSDNAIKVQRIEKMLKLGLATKMDQLEAQSRFDELRSATVQSENDVEVSLKRLERLVGRVITDVEAVDVRLWQRSEALLKRDEWHDLAQKNALIVRLAERRHELAKLDMSAEEAGHWPELILRAGFNNNTDSYTTNIKEERTLELELKVPLYSGGGVSSRVTAAKHLLKSSEFNLRDQRKFVRVKLSELLSRLSASVASIQALKLSVASSEAYQEAAEKGMDYGLRGLFDVLEAKSRVYRAQRTLSEQVYANMADQFELLYLVGQLNPEMIKVYLNPEYDVSLMHVTP
ncbi:MAG: TolC family protein [Thiomicrorhabdus sp.]|nr:TolC family protein [Thiomicrorhabdus sp.]